MAQGSGEERDAEHRDQELASHMASAARISDEPNGNGGGGGDDEEGRFAFAHAALQEEHMIDAAEAFVKEAFKNHDPSHDWLHVNRVRLMAMSLTRCPSLTTKPDKTVVQLAALFHDLCDAKYLPPGIPASQTKASAVLTPFFGQNGAGSSLAPDRRDLVCRIVDNVSWSKDERRRGDIARQGEQRSAMDQDLDRWLESCAEFACVSDADRLDAIGSIGILRCAAFSAIKSRPLHVPPANPDGISVPPAEQGEGYNGSAIAHFHEKLLKIRGERLRTEAARKEAERRQALMQSFLDELDFEWFVADRGAQIALLE